MDAKHLMQVVKAKDGNSDLARQYMLSSGMVSSALEHSVPEQFFSTPETPAEGVSAVKALQIANDQGVPIYTINKSNVSFVMTELQVSENVKYDIQMAVNSGKIVTVSKSNVNYNGWTGCGYIVIDPETGSGAYMISGGLNGAVLFFTGIALIMVGIGVAIGSGGAGALPGGALIALGLLYVFVGLCMIANNSHLFGSAFNYSLFIGGIAATVVGGSWIPGIVLTVIGLATSEITNWFPSIADNSCGVNTIDRPHLQQGAW